MKKMFAFMIAFMALIAIASLVYANGNDTTVDDDDSDDLDDDDDNNSTSVDDDDDRDDDENETEIDDDDNERNETRKRIEIRDGDLRMKYEERLKDGDLRMKYEDRIRDEIEKRKNNPRQEGDDERLRKMLELKEKMRENNGMINVQGRNITISDLSEEHREIIAGKINARTGLNLTAEDVNSSLGILLRAYLSNGKHADVKIMPDRAAEVALKRMRANCEDRNCSVELKEVGVGNKTRAAWVVQTDKDARMFFLFKKKMVVKAEVDPETGQVLSVSKPWWSFMAKEKNALDSEIEQEVKVEASS